MDFARMKRRELQALCKGHGLPAGGTNADLVARLNATLSGRGGVEEEAVGVVVGKGCFKRSAGGEGSDAAKKVSFVLEDEAEVDVGGRRRLRSKGMGSPVAPKKRGRQRKTIPGAGGSRGERRRTRSQVGAGDGDAGEAVADAPVRRSRRNAADLGAGDGADRVAGVVTRNSSAKAEHEEEGLGEAVDRKHRRKRKTRENDTEDVDDSGAVGVSRRSTRSSGIQLGPAIVPSPVVEKKRGRTKAGDVKEPTFVKEQSAEVQHVGRTLRSGLVVASPVLPIVAESKRRRWKTHEEDPAAQKVAKVEVSGRTTRSSSVAVSVKLPIVVEKKRRRKTQDVQSNEEPHSVPEVPVNNVPVTRVLRNRAVQVDGTVLEETLFGKKLENKRPSSRPGTRSCVNQHLASSVNEETQEQVAAPCKGLPRRRSKRNHSEESDSGKVSAIEMQMEVLEPVRRSHPKSVFPSFLEYETKDMHEEVKKQQTVLKPVKRSTRKSVVPAMIEKGRKGQTTETIPEARVRRSIKKSVLPMVNSENNDHADIIRSEDVQSAKSEEMKKQSIRRFTRKSALLAVPMTKKERKSVAAEMNPDAHVRRSMRKSVVPNLLDNDDSDQIEMQSAKGGAVEKQVVVKEPVRRSTQKSVVPDVFVKENNRLHEKLKSEVPVRRLVGKPITPNAGDKEHKDHREIVRREESSVRTRTSRTRFQFAAQNDKSLQRTTRSSSKLVISQIQSESTASKGRPAKRRTAAVQEVRPVEEHKEKQIADIANTTDVIEAGTGIDLDSAVLPLPAGERSNLQDDQLNSNLEGTEVVESRPSGDKNADDILAFGSSVNSVGIRNPSNSSLLASSMDLYQQHELPGGLLADKPFEVSALCSKSCDLGAAGTTEKSPCDFAIPEGKQADSLLKEAVHSMKNDAGRCSPNVEQSPIGLQALFNHGNAEELNTHNAIPCSENGVKEPDVLKVECRAEIIVSSGLDSYQGPHEDLSRIEENVGCMVLSQHNNDQEGFSLSSQTKDLVASTLSGMSEDANHIVREIITEDVICNKDEEKDLIPSSDVDAAYESHADEPEELVSGVSEAQFCISRSTPTLNKVNLNSDSSQAESLDALDNRIASPHVPHLAKECLMDPCQEQELKLPEDLSVLKSTEGAAVCQDESVIGPGICQTIEQTCTDKISRKDREEKCNEHIEDQVTSGILASDISEPAVVEGSENGATLLRTAETLAFPGDQVNTKLEGNLDYSLSCDKDTSDTGSFGNNNLSSLKDPCMDPYNNQELPNDMPAPKSLATVEKRALPDEQADEKLEGDEEYSLNKDASNISDTGSRLNNPSMDPCHDEELPNDMPAPKSTPAAEMSAFPDEQVNTKVGGDEECNLSCDKDTSNISDTRWFVKKDISSLKNSSIDSHHDQVFPDDMRTPQSPEEHAVCLDGSVSESVAGKCQTSGRRRVEEINTKLPSFKISSTVKGSYIAMDVPRSADQWNNLTESAIALHRDSENTAVAEIDHLKPNTDHLVAMDSSAQVVQSISVPPKDAEFATDKPDMEQVQQDVVHVQEGTPEKTALVSATPEHKYECRLPDDAELHSLKNDRCSSSVEQSPFLQSLFSQKRTEVPMEYGVLSLAGVQADNGVCEAKDCDVECGVENSPLGEPIVDHDAHVDFTSQQDTENEGLRKACHEQEQDASGQFEFLEAANCTQDTNSKEMVHEDEENKDPVHSTDMITSCETMDANGPIHHASGISDALLGNSLITPTNGNDEVQPSSNQNQLESTDFLDDQNQIGCCNTEVPQQGLEEQCEERKEDQVAHGISINNIIEAETAIDLESGGLPLPAEERSNLSADNKNGSNSHIELDIEKNASSEPDSGQGFHEGSSRIENVGYLNSLEVYNEQEGSLNSSRNKEFVTSPQLDSSDDVNRKESENFTEEVICKEDEKWQFVPSPDIDAPHEKSHTSGPAVHATGVSSPGAHIFAEGNVNSNTGELESLDALDNRVAFSNTEVQVNTGIDASVETSALPDEQLNSELEVDEYAEHNFSGDEDTNDLFRDLFHFDEDDHLESVQGQELPSDKSASESPKKPGIWQTSGQEFKEETNTELHQDYKEESNISEPALVEGLGNGMTTETSPWPDGQANPELEGDKSKEHGCSFGPEKNQISIEEYNEDNEDRGNH
ncbi:uncharacterized protein LOC100832285 isoform X1 [Brachypodium distachyon]|uniref:SAP domain-containing protein n=1 Tax=Brachypodium distachyon TaxID=15368 RepID=A0A0Q3F0C4_BRADI|nr:uncharacterized protein LOC100832285 isoform X1 [Brachypodium distachyon]KQJ92108.1 hypothetical protein BRADI_4g41696v3 [Brachypodium distachyon]|eukprot:XP_003578863.2 uncharacterized protein LOC100832285 isoform X1 [Brachypodium distachyon]